MQRSWSIEFPFLSIFLPLPFGPSAGDPWKGSRLRASSKADATQTFNRSVSLAARSAGHQRYFAATFNRQVNSSARRNTNAVNARDIYRPASQLRTVVALSTMSQVNYERLIALVKQHPALYDYAHPAHCNRDVTGRLWSKIAAQLDTNDVHCKTKWATLRSNFVREIRRMRPSEDGTVWPPQWPLFKPLMFLLPFLKTRGSTGVSVIDDTSLAVPEVSESGKRSSDDPSMEKINHKKKRTEVIPAEEDQNDDKLFMLSLVPKMRLLPPEENLKFRLEVQQLLLRKFSSLEDEDEDEDDSDFNEEKIKVETIETEVHFEDFQLDQD